MELHSISLAGAMIALALETVAALLGRRRWVVTGAIATFALLGLSIGSHVLYGHRPGTGRSLGLTGFVAEHPAFWLVAIAGGVVAWWGGRHGSKRGRIP